LIYISNLNNINLTSRTEEEMSYNKREAKAKKKRQEWEDHTESRLRDNFDAYSKEINRTLEGLLNDQRVDKDKNTVTEDQLGEERVDTRHAVTEKLMDTEKASFGNIMRNAEKTSDIPPLDADREKNKSDEPYEAANKKPKKRP